MARSKFAKTKEQREKEVNELSEMLKEGVKGFLNSESYRDLLDNLAMFHQYSWRNSALIMLQNPKATYCASYKDWKEKFNRQVQSTAEVGHGYKILVPTFRKVYKTELDGQGNPILDAEGNEVRTYTGTKALAGYVTGTVHDVSQTKQIEGKPVVNIDMGSMVKQLDGSIDEYQDLMSALGNISPAIMQFEDIQTGANGYFSPSENRIAIKQGLSPLHTIKTYIHEISHAMLHNNGNINEFKKQGIELTRQDKETQAESIAYIVCKHLGIDSSDYSFGYVAGWAHDDITLETNLNIIKNTSSRIIDAIDEVLNQRQLAKEWQVDFDLKWSEKVDELHEMGDISESVYSHIMNHFDEVSQQIVNDMKLFIREHNSDKILATKQDELPDFLNEHKEIYMQSICNVLEIDSLDQEMEKQHDIEI